MFYMSRLAFLRWYSTDICTLTIKNIRNMHAASTDQIGDILHFNDNCCYQNLCPNWYFRIWKYNAQINMQNKCIKIFNINGNEVNKKIIWCLHCLCSEFIIVFWVIKIMHTHSGRLKTEKALTQIWHLFSMITYQI